jgi:TPR repeat protein
MTPGIGPTPETTLALFFGASRWPDAPKFQDAPSFERSADALIGFLREPEGAGLPWRNIKSFFNSLDDAAEQLEQATLFIERFRRSTAGTDQSPRDLLVFYVGHGDFEGEARDFYLSIRRTQQKRPLITSITAHELGNLIRRSAGDLRTYMIVDCCFAAALQHGFMTSPLGLAELKLHEALPPANLGLNALVDDLPGSGVALLAAAGLNKPALAPSDHNLTAFTTALLDVLKGGHARLGPRLSLQDLHLLVERRVFELFPDAARPEMRPLQQGRGRVELVGFFPNPAFQTIQNELRLVEEQRKAEEERRKAEEAARAAEEKRQAEAAARAAEDNRPAEEKRRVEEAARAAEEKQQAKNGQPDEVTQLVGEPLKIKKAEFNRKPTIGIILLLTVLSVSIFVLSQKLSWRPQPESASDRFQRGLNYEKGEGGLPKSDTDAVHWYRLAADQGNAAAQNKLALMYEDGRGGLPKSDADAVHYLRLAADQGDTAAQNNLGAMYADGRGGLPKSDVDAVYYYRLAANAGRASAQNNLGTMYENGRGGLPKSDVDAVRYYRLAADQGNAMAKYNLARAYEEGRGGLKKSRLDAIRYYKQASDQGDQDAKLALQRLGQN